MYCHQRKLGVVGLGNVGVTAAYAVLLQGLVDELVLVSRDPAKAEAEKLDLEHGLPFLQATTITATNDYALLQGCDVVVVTAGVAQKPGETRLQLIEKNAAIMVELAPKLQQYATDAVIVVVSNPVDILTFQLVKALGFAPGRVFGSGTMLDTARFRFHLAEFLDMHPKSIHAYILGEHGESAFPAVDHASVGGQSLLQFPGYTQEKMLTAFQATRQAAARIIQAKGATYYAIGVVIAELVRVILADEKVVLPVSVPLENYYGQSGVAASVPCVVGRMGVERVLQVELSAQEQQQFAHSCQVLRENI